MMLDEIDSVLNELEKSELEAQHGGVPPKAYAQMLAIYLYQNNLCYAKYLWKRIPQSVKTSHAELQNIWKVGQKMWQRDWLGVHAMLQVEWSEDVVEVMNALKESTRERAMVLVSETYSSLNTSTLASMTGLTTSEAQQAATERGWTIDESMVQPIKPDKQQNVTAQDSLTEDQLYKLTQFVSFLEN